MPYQSLRNPTHHSSVNQLGGFGPNLLKEIKMTDNDHKALMEELEQHAYRIFDTVKHLLTEEDQSTLKFLLGIN